MITRHGIGIQEAHLMHIFLI